MKQVLLRSCLPAVLAFALTNPAHAALQTFTNNYSAWAAAAGSVSTVDFETLPDGSGSVAGTRITPSFNYASQNVTFSSNSSYMAIHGNSVGGFGLAVGDWMSRDTVHIRADLNGPRHAFGLFFPGNTTLSVYDTAGNLLGSNSFSSGGDNFFMGFVSDTPIAYAISSRQATMEYWQSVSFSSVTAVPEPQTWAMFGIGLMLLAGFAKRRRAI